MVQWYTNQVFQKQIIAPRPPQIEACQAIITIMSTGDPYESNNYINREWSV